MKDILIVEDSQTERERLVRLCSEEGFSHVAFEAIEPARQFLRSQRVRLAILDIGLQDGSGSTLFHEIRRDQRSDFVIIYTGNPSAHLKERFTSQGADQYIVKGSSRASDKAVRQQIRELLGEPSHQRVQGMPLAQFLSDLLPEESRVFFSSTEGGPSACANCGGRDYIVDFSRQVQFPPDIHGQVLCTECGTLMSGDVEE